jgi:hypothetical protein
MLALALNRPTCHGGSTTVVMITACSRSFSKDQGTVAGSELVLPKTSAPAMRALASIGVTRLDQLAEHREPAIATLHGMGPKALAILKEAMALHGLAFLP